MNPLSSRKIENLMCLRARRNLLRFNGGISSLMIVNVFKDEDSFTEWRWGIVQIAARVCLCNMHFYKMPLKNSFFFSFYRLWNRRLHRYLFLVKFLSNWLKLIDLLHLIKYVKKLSIFLEIYSFEVILFY